MEGNSDTDTYGLTQYDFLKTFNNQAFYTGINHLLLKKNGITFADLSYKSVVPLINGLGTRMER